MLAAVQHSHHHKKLLINKLLTCRTQSQDTSSLTTARGIEANLTGAELSMNAHAPLPPRRLELLVSDPDLTVIAEDIVANVQWSFFGLDGIQLHEAGHERHFCCGNVC